ncbi:alpha-N-arabinofuranosidase [Phytoactinopolyspora limicola]|uniref:arabinosylfuranosidase ArfA n=1 Tax=Phytoactinopolyspora limicola TaxID=2715536 RepID=UPI001FE626EA|nr:alpha-N-arabinofuranosidase [Phytoactinopolyspora limicola]
MYDVHVGLDPAFSVGTVDPRIYGSFVEHMGRCVYGGIFEPDHPTADEHGFRKDVAELVRELGVTNVRYPGGNFVSNYRWEDGVGPVQDRPKRLDLAWRSIEPNTVGVDEFAEWTRGLGLDPVMAVNLGTRGVRAAVELLEYCNLPAGSTTLADRRAANGRREPHGIRTWCLGNEMDGPWQIGHKTADEYGRLAAETARAMRRTDPDIELVVCGSSNSGMPTFGSWERTVLEHTYDLVDHISLHAYYEPVAGDIDSFLTSSENMRRMISAVTATADHVAAVKRSRKRMTVSFDEWNVWYQSRFPGEAGLAVRSGGPLIEDEYNVTDAVVVGDLLMALLDNADRVAIANQAQLVNVIAPIRTEPGSSAWRQTIFHPFALTAKYARGTVLQTQVRGTSLATGKHGDVPATRVSAVHDPTTGGLTLLATNRDRHRPAALRVSLRAFAGEGHRLVEHLTLSDADPSATNTADRPDRVTPRPVDGTTVRDGQLEATLPPASWHLVRLHPAQS